MIVIFNRDGSVYDSNLSDYVQQGSNGANILYAAYVDSTRDGLSAYLVAERPNSTTITLPARRATFSCNGERYHGWQITITGSFTLYAGTVRCTLNVVDEDEDIIANYPFEVTVNATGNPLDENWDQRINAAQYNEYMAQLADKAIISRVDSVDELPNPGQRGVIYLVGGGTSYEAYAWDPEAEEYKAMGDSVYVVSDITQADLSGYGEGQVIYDKASDSFYSKTGASPYYELINDKGVLGAPHILCRADASRTIEELHATYGDSRYIVLSYLDKDFIYFSKKTGSTYTAVAFDAEEQRFYKATGLSGSALPSSVLVPANKIEIASKALLSSDYVPYSGANKDLSLNGFRLRNAVVETEYGGEYHDSYKNQRNTDIANVGFVLRQNTEIENGSVNPVMYQYFLKENATLLCGGLLYKKLTETASDLIYVSLNASITAQLDGTTIKLGKVIYISKTEVSDAHAYTEADLTIDLYSKAQAQAKFGTALSVSIDPTTYVMTLVLKNANNGTLSTQTVDLPLESIVSSATYYDTYTYDGTTYTKVIVITLSTTSVPTIVPVGDLISGLEKEACVEIPVSPTSGTFTADEMALLALDNASIKVGGYTYLHKVLANQFIAKSAFVSADGYKTESEYKVVVQNNGNYTLTSTTINFYDKDQVDTKVTGLQTDMAKMKKDIDYALKYPLVYGTPTTDTEEEVGLTTSQLPATALPKGLINYVGGMSQKVNQLVPSNQKTFTNSTTDTRTPLNFSAQVYLNGQYQSSILYDEISVVGTHNVIMSVPSGVSGDTILLVHNGAVNNIEIAEIPMKIVEGQKIFLTIDFTGVDPTIVGGLSSKDLSVSNLTNDYGAGNEPTSTSDSRIQWLLNYLAENPEYNEGEIISAEVTNLKSTDGVNTTNYPIPAEVQALDGYGLGIDDTLYNYTDFEGKKFVKKVRKYAFTGNEEWRWSDSGNGFWYAYVDEFADVVSGYWLVKSLVSNGIVVRLVKEDCSIRVYAEDNSGITDQTDMNALMNSSVEMVYSIETPTETDISEYLDRDFPNENIIDTYQGGEVEFENENDMAVPYSLTYQYKVE